MPFGEYELSPGLIGLSLLRTAHREAFQRLFVRPSIPCYRDFSLAMRRSPGFASAAADSTPSSGSPSLRLTALSALTSPATATRRLIMQKARRHPTRGLRPLVGARVQGLFQPPRGVLFTFPSRYSFAIGLTGVFSLAGWARRIRAGLLVPRATQGCAGGRKGFAYWAVTIYGRTFQTAPLAPRPPHGGPTTPERRRHRTGLGWPPFARHYWGDHCCFLFLRVLRCFSSPRLPPAHS